MKTKLSVVAAMTLGIGGLLYSGCESMNNSNKGTITKSQFGHLPDGRPVDLYTLKNGKGMEARIATYGGIVTSLMVPDKTGRFSDVVLGYDNLDGYIKNNPFFGALIGRYGNRIANGRFTLDGATYVLPQNNGSNCLHGGIKGFDKVVWNVVKAEVKSDGPEIELSYLAKDGEEGFPGNLDVHALYQITENNELKVSFRAKTDKKTVVNLTHHSYFNLRGQGDVLNHMVTINADRFTPVDANLIPTGELRPVKGTPFDFTTPHTIGERINAQDEQIKLGNGYDHNWVANKGADNLSLIATVSESTSGRVMEVWSTEPGTQFYTGNFLDGSITGKGNWVYAFRNGFCMEPQHYPDSPNKPQFPSTTLFPGETYKNTIIYKFSVKK